MSQKMSILRKFMNYAFMKLKRNFRNIVISGRNYSLLFVDFVCISMGSIFSGVLPCKNLGLKSRFKIPLKDGVTA